ncbi:MAG: hypothetical protein AABW45_02285 [Nanoarchaeota archaeon]
MNLILNIITALIIIFFTCIFFLSRIFVPNLGFRRSRLPRELPKEFENAIIKIKKQSKDKEDFAKKIYYYLTKKFHGEPGRVWNDFPFLFVKNVNKLWSRTLLHCHQLNYLYRIALVKSKLFYEKDIKIIHGFFMFNIHQYLEINIGRLKEKWVKVDLFAKTLGFKFGQTLPKFFNVFKYWKKRKTSFFSFFSIISHIFRRIF